MDEDDEWSEEEAEVPSSSEDEAGGRRPTFRPVSFVAAGGESDESEDERVGLGGKRGSVREASWRSAEYDDEWSDDFRPSFGEPKQTSSSSSGQKTSFPTFISFSKATRSEKEEEEDSYQEKTSENLIKQDSVKSNKFDQFGRDIEHEKEVSKKDIANHQAKLALRQQLMGSVNTDVPVAKPASSLDPNKQKQKSTSTPSTSIPQKDGFSSMALKYMQKYNFTGRLGKHGQGIAAPIEVMSRPDGAGLGSVQEASSLATNKANTEHLERIRLEAVEKELKERRFLEEQLELQKVWKKITDPFIESPVPKSMKEEKLAEGIMSAVDSILLTWKERADNYRREINVNEAIAKLKVKERDDAKQELQKIDERTTKLNKVLELLQVLESDDCTPSQVEKTLISLRTDFDIEVWQDYELARLPPLLIKHCIQLNWDSDQDLCLDMAEAVVRSCPSAEYGKNAVSSVLVKLVAPRLNHYATKWDIMKDPPLELLYHPWLPYLIPTLDSVLAPVVSALERELEEKWTDLENINRVQKVVEPWRELCGGTEFIQELIARSFGSKLFDEENIKLCRDWFDAGLLSLSDFVCCCEGVMQKFVRPNSQFSLCIERLNISEAANLYRGIKAYFPLESLDDSCCNGRLRHIFDYALEMLQCAMTGRVVDTRIANSIEPAPTSFSDAWFRVRHAPTTKGGEIASDFTSMGTLQQTVESIADSLGKDFHAHPEGKKVDGKKVYVIGKKYCYFDSGVIFSSTSMKNWKPVSLEKLLES